MLFILTGAIQEGKTRWLSGLVDDLTGREVECLGVLAPGVWIPAPGGLEKVGIDNILLPSGERVTFAIRRDLARDERFSDPGSQSAQAKLGWAISDDAIDKVNGHFHDLASRAQTPACGLLIVDELGRLELAKGSQKGLTEAVGLLEQGPQPAWPHALIVVRDYLCDAAFDRFAPIWGAPYAIGPEERAHAAIMEAVIG